MNNLYCESQQKIFLCTLVKWVKRHRIFHHLLYIPLDNRAKTISPRQQPAFIGSGTSFLPIRDSSMSDKFFFKGRQDARQHHTAHGGFQINANKKPGSKKFPLTLVVTSEARKQEVEVLVAEAGLFASITVDASANAVESIGELTTILDKGETVTQAKVPARNDPCSCGSGVKFKKCCG
ncbi:MAG: PBPRA1643 family SWIM/SEC-C metal-binding motif protein [Marinobacter sp.]